MKEEITIDAKISEMCFYGLDFIFSMKHDKEKIPTDVMEYTNELMERLFKHKYEVSIYEKDDFDEYNMCPFQQGYLRFKMDKKYENWMVLNKCTVEDINNIISGYYAWKLRDIETEILLMNINI